LSHIQKIVLKGDPASIVCQNITSYMGGTKDIWRNSSKLGVEFHNPENDVNSNEKEEKEKHYFDHLIKAEQSISDGKLEFFFF